jgi:hypothetical protein
MPDGTASGRERDGWWRSAATAAGRIAPMTTRTAIAAIALGRIGLGAALLAAPGGLVGAGWVGAKQARRPVSSLMIRAVGARDVALGLGTLLALRNGDALAPWLIGGALADGTDVVATALAGGAVPARGRAAVAAVGGGACVAQLALLPAAD